MEINGLSHPAPIRTIISSKGQALVEFALTLPLMLLLVLGIIEMAYALYDQHIITKLTREGSNLISRDKSIQDAETAMNSMTNPPVNFSSNSKLIFSVLKKVGTIGTANYNKVILYQRHQIGTLSAQSIFTTQGAGSFGGAPNYVANNSDTDTSLQITNVPASLQIPLGGFTYVTEIYTQHSLITPFDKIGLKLPTTLYSIAYF
jgi:Flp pilus assembly protein TadG